MGGRQAEAWAMFQKVGTFGLGLSVIRGQDAISIMMMMTNFFPQLMASLSSKEKWYNALNHCRYYNYTLSVNGKPEYHKDSYPRDYLTDVIRS